MLSKVFGDKSRFAIEVRYDLAKSTRRNVCGLFFYWVHNEQIGCEGGYDNLTDAFNNMSWKRVHETGRRSGERLCELSPAAFRHWWTTETLPDGFAVDDVPNDIERFDLMFDFGEWHSDRLFLLDCGQVGRLIWSAVDNGPLVVVEDKIAHFEGLLAAAYEFMRSLHEAEPR